MNRAVGLAVGVIMSVFLNAAVNAGPNSTAAIQGTEGQVPQSGQATANDTAKLSKRNQAVIQQAEAAKNRRENNRATLSKRNQAKIIQEAAAKNRRDMIEQSKADSTK